LLLVVGHALIAAACNKPTYSRKTLERDLRDDSGLSATQAQCVAMRLESTIGTDRLGARDEPTTREQEKLHAALVFAALACGARPYDADAAAKVLRTKARVPATYADCLAREFGRRQADELPDPADAWQPKHVRALQVPILESTIDCANARGANTALEIRRNLGVSRQQSTCILAGASPAQAFAGCTTSTTTTTTTSASTSTSIPPSTAPSSTSAP
jgi:hypothetical protein